MFCSLPSLPCRQHALQMRIALCVIVVHLGLLGAGKLWQASPLAFKPRPKVLVQTITLKPSVSTPITLTRQEELLVSHEEDHPLVHLTDIPLTAPQVKPLQPQVDKKKVSPQVQKNQQNNQEQLKKLEAQKQQQVKVEAEKKRQQQPRVNAEKKHQQKKIEVEKEKPQAKTEVEKKRQQDKAHANEKRRQDQAAAQAASQQQASALLAKAKQNLAKVEESRNKMSTSSSLTLNLETRALPKELKDLQIDALLIEEMGSTKAEGSRELAYQGEVASYLKAYLRLPDYGSVRVNLTLDRTGKVIKVDIVSSESKKNKVYLESKLPSLLFPSFGQRFQGLSQKTFAITLQNET